MTILTDSFNRRINYLRISILDRCNLRCMYCMPEKGVQKLEHDQILRVDQIIKALYMFSDMGIDNLRITGGEPLIRQDIKELFPAIGKMKRFKEIAITTNGVLLSNLTDLLLKSGVKRLNISLDSLRPDVFQKITGKDKFKEVMHGIETAIEAGFDPVKINTVYLPGINDNEVADFFNMAIEKPVHVRFIEHMPVLLKDKGLNDRSAHHLVLNQLIECFKSTFSDFSGDIKEYCIDKSLKGSGPGTSYAHPVMKGSVGLIWSSSKSICNTCNRLRLHANGDIAYCLFAHEFYNIKEAFEKNRPVNDIKNDIHEYIMKKPFCHDGEYTRDRPMSSIGG